MDGGENAQNQANEANQANGHTNQGEGSLSPELLSDPRRSESGYHIDTVEPVYQTVSTESQPDLARAATLSENTISSSGVQRYVLEDSSAGQGAAPRETEQENTQRSSASEDNSSLKTPSNGQGSTCVKPQTSPRVSDRSSTESNAAVSPLAPVPFGIDSTAKDPHLDPSSAPYTSIPVEVFPRSSRSAQEILSTQLFGFGFPAGKQRELTLNLSDPKVVAEILNHPCGDDMATGYQRMSGDARRYNPSSFSRAENRPPMSNVPCRNGPLCRKYAEGTCGYSHDFGAASANGLNVPKKSLNVESPSFTPTFTPQSGNAQPAKMGISPKAATAAAFTPRGSGSATPARTSHSKEPSGEFIPQQAFQSSQQFSEFIPGQSFIPQQIEAQAPMQTQLNTYPDPFLTQATIASLDGTQTQLNPYTQQSQGIGNQQYYSDTANYKHPLNYHLYASIGPRRENLMAYQRSTSDFFIPDNLREDLQRKAEATLQTFANSTLPLNVEYFHSLVALDTNNQKGPSTFGYPSWVYKATSSRDGHTYALRRIEGYRLTNEAAIRTVQSWKRISNGSLVQVHDAFTGRWFNDSSLIVVTDYHPLSQTLADKYFAHGRHPGAGRPGAQIVPENDLWSYIVQLASALKSIHEGGQAAQTVAASKVLVTSKNRLRLNGCGVLDIVQYEQRQPVTESQRSDLEDLGKLILGIAARNQTAYHNVPKALDLVSRSYTERLRACIAWLLTPPAADQDGKGPDVQQLAEYNVNTLLNNIADKVVAAFDSSLHLEDDLTANMMRELENGRLVRLLAKINVILERPETSSIPGAQPSNPSMLNQPSSAWSETGDRFYLKLFRDYVFHQVDPDGRPALDLGHIISCLNKLDAGIDEKIQLVDREEQHVFIVSFREIKRGFESAWADISKASTATRR